MSRASAWSLIVTGSAIVACASNSPITVPSTATPPWDSAGVLAHDIPCDTPIVVHAYSERDGVGAEYAFIRQHLPGARVAAQAMATGHGKSFDILTAKTPEGKEYSVCFDISRFFGRE